MPKKINEKRYLDKDIIKILNNRGGHAKWSEIKKDLNKIDKKPEDTVFGYALRRLIAIGLITKKEDGEYHTVGNPDEILERFQGMIDDLKGNIVIDIIESLISDPLDSSVPINSHGEQLTISVVS